LRPSPRSTPTRAAFLFGDPGRSLRNWIL
jgi:hypothetical protein